MAEPQLESARAPDSADAGAARWQVEGDPTPGAVRVRLAGSWRLLDRLPAANSVYDEVAARGGSGPVVLDGAELSSWDSGLLTFLIKLRQLIAEAQREADCSGLPQGVQRLLRLASAVPQRAGAARGMAVDSWLARIGKATLVWTHASVDVIRFLGEATLAFGRMLRGRARFRHTDLFMVMQEVGVQALPIISLISFLVGVILAFMGAIQLTQFGAQIFVANLVGIGMAREMAAMMVGIILAGRTGAAFAAQLGTMQVNEEIDALSTLGFPPIEFLVLPRMLALILMTPLLCLYANLMGILGGALIGVTVLDLPPVTYLQQTQGAIRLTDFAGGLIKSAVYGAVVAIVGCLRGLQCGRSSAAVGVATTSAVVTSIVFIIVSMAILTVVYNVLGI
ncbi:MAG TPA: ABC transporter permease [Geminicoccaceae bacterium]|nr:ABC transporter permease [Geminicoccaceae bacterium]